MPSLHHEHLVRINDASNPAVAWLTRQQLWKGLLHTIRVPQALDKSIDAADVSEQAHGMLRREIRRGVVSTIDEVKVIAGQILVISADPASAFQGSTLTMRIEEPAPEVLFVRFIYELHGLETQRTEQEDQARRRAYEASDIERVREARRHAALLH
jgi:hypothetical protein